MEYGKIFNLLVKYPMKLMIYSLQMYRITHIPRNSLYPRIIQTDLERSGIQMDQIFPVRGIY